MNFQMKKPIVVGVVGCGYWGPNLVRNFKSLPDCELRAMCDLSEARLKHMRGLYPDVEGMTDFGHMLNGVGVDAVVVAAPVKHHFPLAKAALLSGKHTLIEKPMAASSAECEELIAIAQSKGLVLMVGHTFLYSAAVRKTLGITARPFTAFATVVDSLVTSGLPLFTLDDFEDSDFARTDSLTRGRVFFREFIEGHPKIAVKDAHAMVSAAFVKLAMPCRALN